jgi:hypothetical protein
VATNRHDDPFATVDRLLGEISFYHQELARIVEGYQESFERANGRVNDDVRGFATVIPGARYSVLETYIREQWLVLSAEIKRILPDS